MSLFIIVFVVFRLKIKKKKGLCCMSVCVCAGGGVVSGTDEKMKYNPGAPV